MKYPWEVVWTVPVIWFVIFEAIGIVHELHGGGDTWTFTHYLTRLPMGLKVALIAWLAYHFIWQHPKG
jgi:hypothetical protein